MRRFIFLVFIGVLLIKNATSSKNHGYPSRLEWLFDLTNKQDEKKEENKPTVCQSQECQKIAKIISESVDKSVNPCEDFYQHACGKWKEHNPIPKGMTSWGTFASAQMNVKKQMKEILDESLKKDDHLAVKLAKKWYAVCMDLDAMEKQGLEPLVSTLSRIGGWPLIMEPDEWNEEEYSWQKVDDQYMRLRGKNAFHNVFVITYRHNHTSTRKMIYIDRPLLPPNSSYLFNKKKKNRSDEQSDEKDSQEPGSEEKSDDSDDEDGTSEQSDNKNKAKKKVSMKKIGKFAKNKKLGHNRRMKSSTYFKKYKNHNMKKERIKRTIPTNIREKLRVQKNRRNHLKREHVKRSKKILKTTTSRISNEETIDKNYKYANYISKVARAIAKARGVEVSEEHMNKDIQDMIEFQMKLFMIEDYFRDDYDSNDNNDGDGNDDDSGDDGSGDSDDDSSDDGSGDSDDGSGYGENDDDDDSNDDDDDDYDDDDSDDDDDDDDDDDEEYEDTLNNFQKWYDDLESKTSNSAIDWRYKIKELFDEAQVPINDDIKIETFSLKYYKKLLDLLDETPSRTIVNYIHWNFLSRMIRTTTGEMRKLYNAWTDVRTGKEEEEDDGTGVPKRFHGCVYEVKINDVLAYEYVKRHFSDEIIITASDMIDNIQKEVEYQIKESDWMDEKTKDFVLAKLVNMKKFIGYPNWYRNNTIVKRYLQGLIIGNSYYENILSYERYEKWKNLRDLSETTEIDNEKGISPVRVNAFFSADDNTISFSAADFQSPLFAYDRPQVINYGFIGLIMGHEVNHGFDSDGHKFDKNGNPVEWLSAMAEAYGKRAECFVEQFNNYFIDKTSNYKIKDYGNQTVTENIADTMGLEAAFRAYRRRERQCGKSNIVLPGHEDLSNDQLFFLSFANLWCEYADTTNTTIEDAEFDEHSLKRLRVIGSVSNLQEFAEAYNCPVGSAMNPEKKCHIWK